MDRRKAIVRDLQDGLDRSVRFFESLAPQQVAVEIYQEGARWTALQVLAHFVTIEQSMHRLFQDILAGGEGSPKDFDIDRFNQGQTEKMIGYPLNEMLARFKSVRGQTISMVESMTEKDLDRQGYHAFHGHGRLERFICWAYEHTRGHEDDIGEKLGLPADEGGP